MRANPQLQILGALITLYDKRTLLSKDIREQIRRVFGDRVFKTVITKSVRLEESPAYRESIFTFAPRSRAAPTSTTSSPRRWSAVSDRGRGGPRC